MTTDLRFGLQLFEDAGDYPTMRAFTLEAERLGYDSIWVADHLISPVFGRRAPILEAWTAMTALAAVTSRIRIGAMVLCNSFRHPPLVAKMAATLDHIAGGRLEFGIGSGHFEKEYQTFGYDFLPASERSARLGEALEICKKMWTEERPSYSGRYYRIEDATCRPRPIQEPHPPIWIGGDGEKLTLRLVAKYADKWNCPSLKPAEIARKLAILGQHRVEVGRDPNQIEKTWWGHLVFDENGHVEDALQARAKTWSLPVEEFAKRSVAGSASQCVDQIEQLVAAGMTYFVFTCSDLRDFRTPRIIVDDIIARLK